MSTCPKCGHKWPDDKRAKGGKARWRGTTKVQRKKAASDAAKARWANRPKVKAAHRASLAGRSEDLSQAPG